MGILKRLVLLTKEAQVILSLRGFLLLLLGLYLLAVPAFFQADIIATVLALSLLFLILTTAALVVAQGIFLKKNLTLSFASSETSPLPLDEGIIAGRPYQGLFKISKRYLFPFFLIELRFVFNNSESPIPPFLISGTASAPAQLHLSLNFPHRGVWKLLRCECKLRDQFAFSKFTWDLDCQHAFKVKPAPIDCSPVPPMSSCHRSGDVAIDVTNRHGEPFDLKRYHPSDGIKKILWKVYAKSRELISRHPEASFSPEWQVVLFVIANEHEDSPCSQAVAYMRLLEDLDLEPFLGASTFTEECYAKNAEEALDMLIEKAWLIEDVLGSLRTFINDISKSLNSTRLVKILFFMSQERLATPGMLDTLLQLTSLISSRQIEPVFVISQERDITSLRTSPSTLKDKFISLFWHQTSPKSFIKVEKMREFFEICNKSNWELIIV
ncbi:MAG: DUF58 domain-containing protein [SAR324 cluster bacterium]|uniref:DUF58 domain-containing protein n=1 Tax=SAR324 cluster bacterium TaxID=2024889 RepID=A0A7X9FSC2_9DELT|nr:DUF58 domain-containing protein [SAR324 cluster bacterium]